jgi:hypothetical protein
MLQSYTTPSSVAQPTHGQRQAAHDTSSIPAQSQHWQANPTAFSEPISTLQEQTSQHSVAQSTHGQSSTAHASLTAAHQTTLTHRCLLSPSTGRPVAFPLWEVLAPSSLMRWPLRSQHRRVGNLRLSTWQRQTSCYSSGAGWDQPSTAVVSPRGPRRSQPPTQHHRSHRAHHLPALAVA